MNANTKLLPAIKSMTAEEALDYVNDQYSVILAFAREEDLQKAWRQVGRKCNLLTLDVIRVEPTEENAIDLQISRHPTYILYRAGNEDWTCLGNVEFMKTIDGLAR